MPNCIGKQPKLRTLPVKRSDGSCLIIKVRVRLLFLLSLLGLHGLGGAGLQPRQLGEHLGLGGLLRLGLGLGLRLPVRLKVDLGFWALALCLGVVVAVCGLALTFWPRSYSQIAAGSSGSPWATSSNPSISDCPDTRRWASVKHTPK